MHELDNPWEFQFLNQNYHEAPIHNGVMKSKKPDPDRGETNENLWNSEKQISSLLSYLKFLTSESLSFQKKKKGKIPPEINLNVKKLAHLKKSTSVGSGLKEEIIDEAPCKQQIIQK